MKRILINKSLTDELRIALVDGARLFDLDSETNEIKILKGSILKQKFQEWKQAWMLHLYFMEQSDMASYH